MDGRLYTRGGDKGQTSLAGGERVRKDDPRIEAYGELDEALSLLGVARAETNHELLRSVLVFAQQRLMNATALVEASVGPRGVAVTVTKSDVEWLERAADRLQEGYEPLSAFVLPGASKSSAFIDAARAAVRRAERRFHTLDRAGPSDDILHAFMNRLSDTLYAAARYAAAVDGARETAWDPKAAAPEF